MKWRVAHQSYTPFHRVLLCLYLSSSLIWPPLKTTLTDYQCVSTGCCIHVAKSKISIDNQHVTKSLQRYKFLPKQPKENKEKITNLMIFLDSDCLLQVCLSYISVNVATFLIQPILLYILQINKENIPPIDIQPIFKCDFCSFLAKIGLKL